MSSVPALFLSIHLASSVSTKMVANFALLLLVSAISAVVCQDEPGVIWMPSPHITYGRNGYTAKWLILHGTAGGSSAEAIGRWFQDPNSRVSAHYTVDQVGTIVQSVNERDTAWANGRIENGADPWWGPANPNSVTISIEHVKSSTDNSNELTPAQLEASIRLSKSIIARNPGITPDWANANGGITGHFSMSPISRERCPGPFPWTEYFSGINDGQPIERCMGTITADSLYIRSQPNTSGSVKGYLLQGATVQPTERVEGESVGGNTGWYYITSGAGTGYISAHYVRLHDGARPEWCY